MGKLFLCGDCHNDVDIHKLTTKKFPIQKELTKDDVMVVLGDWGAIWFGNSKDNYMINWWDNKPWTTFVVLGNHCNYNAIEKLPEVYKFGNSCYKAGNSIYIAKSGNIYTICGEKCLAINGADSYDRDRRTENINWWRQERITQDDYNNASISLAQNNDEIDFLFTHTGGSEVCRFLGFNPTPSDYWIDMIKETISPDCRYKHYCGHYHVDKIVYRNIRILYDDIVLVN